MADVYVLCVSGLPAVPLKPNEIYRIGKQAGLEICIADESMELAHGIVSLLRSGIVRIAAVAGRIFVNEEEKQISDIRKEDASDDGKVRLRFGNVEASLRFKEANEEAQDSSGFGECLKDRTVDTSNDSLCIPETQPPSANASVNTTADSFFIPETQAMVFERPTEKSGKVSLGDDFVIPETENYPDPGADLLQETTTRGSDASESSGLGSQIRICTQDFNDFNEDAIDDFDSSLMLGDAMMALEKPKTMKQSPEKLDKKQDNQTLDATDHEMSALNWSATNSKCTVFNSTKADEVQRAATCITPDLSAPLADDANNRDISTPDIFELMEAHEEEEHAAQRSNATTPQLCGIKQLVVATIETPRTTQSEEADESGCAEVENQEMNQDFVATQAFPARVTQLNQDLIATQIFPSKGNISDADINQDFIATQAFPSPLPPQTKQQSANQDFIATQVFPTSKDQIFPSDIELPSLNQDFVATQAFPSRFPKPKEFHEKKPNQDFIATQVFPSKSLTSTRAGQDFVETQPFHVNKENIPQDSDSWGDEIEEILKEMTSGNVVSSPVSTPNEETLKYVTPCVIKDKDHNRKVFLFENVFPSADSQSRWKNEVLVEEKRSLKRVASTDSQPPFVTPSKRDRRLSEHSERLGDDCFSLSNSRKRQANLPGGDKSEPPIKSLRKVIPISENAELSTEDEATAPEVKVTKRPTRRAKTKSRSHTPEVETNQVKKVKRTRSKQATIQEDKPKENPPKLIRTRQQSKCLELEEICTKPKEEMMTKKKAAGGEPTNRGFEKPVETSSKRNPEADKEEQSEQSAAKRGRKKPIDSANKDSEEAKPQTKRRPGRPRKESSAEDLNSKAVMPESKTDNSLGANKEEPLKLKKKLVVRLKRDVSMDAPSTSNAAKKGNAVEEKVSQNSTSATNTRLSQINQTDTLKALNKYVRQAKVKGKIKIAFTMCDRQALDSVIRALKHVVDVTEDPQQCDVLIMDKGERTFKFLTAIASNKPVFNSKWLESIKSTKTIGVKDEHVFNDSSFEKAFKFDPLSVLQHPLLLNGFNFLLGEGIQPNANEMKVIIQSAGGTVHSKPPPLASSHDLYVVTTSKDTHCKQRLRNYENVHYIKTEGVMASLVQHKVELLTEHKVKL